MDKSRLAMLVLATAVLSCGMALPQQTSRPAPKPTASGASKPATTSPRTVAPLGSLGSKDPFIGVWRVSSGAVKGLTRTYEDRGGGTIFMTTEVSGDSATRSYLVYKRDGKPYPEAGVGVESIRMVTVTGSNPRTEQVSFTASGKTSAMSGSLTISDDGKTLTQVLSGTSAKGQPFTNTLVYDRQP